jgi:hypothetical protein
VSAKLQRLPPFKETPPIAKEACAACEAFAPECLVPVGDAAVPMCWLCAHHVVEHNTAPHHAYAAECECTPQEIYPHRVFTREIDKSDRRENDEREAFSGRRVSDRLALTQNERERAQLLASPPAKVAAFAREAHKQMSPAQREAVKKRLS